jgi:hypothetical protein
MTSYRPTTDAAWIAQERERRVWRYMSFSRFVWLLHRKQLWLARADTLGDPWKIALAGAQLDHIIRRHPPPRVPLSEANWESAMKRVARIIPAWRQQTFVNCWSASDHESHALWRIFCGPTEGVAIQTTLGKLHNSSGGVSIFPVVYEQPGSHRRTPELIELATRKRLMFDYEREVRLIHIADRDQAETLGVCELGRCLDWNPEDHADGVLVHPPADASFMETVTGVVEHFAPALRGRVSWSAMRDRPPV